MTFNFTLNNLITYRDQRLWGWDWLRGLLSFDVICSVGAVANVGIATFVYAERPSMVARWSSRCCGRCSLELCIIRIFHMEAPLKIPFRFEEALCPLQ